MKLKTVKKKKKDKVNETKNWFFERNEYWQTIRWANQMKKGKETQITNFRNDVRFITTGTMDIERIIKDYYEQFVQTSWLSNFLKETNYQKWPKEKYITWITLYLLK